MNIDKYLLESRRRYIEITNRRQARKRLNKLKKIFSRKVNF